MECVQNIVIFDTFPTTIESFDGTSQDDDTLTDIFDHGDMAPAVQCGFMCLCTINLSKLQLILLHRNKKKCGFANGHNHCIAMVDFSSSLLEHQIKKIV